MLRTPFLEKTCGRLRSSVAGNGLNERIKYTPLHDFLFRLLYVKERDLVFDFHSNGAKA